jgi:dTDP-glucose 4,6-dehydratase
MTELMRRHAIHAVINFAAESHVDRSIMSAEPFLDTNVTGTVRLLEAARAAGVQRFVQISTDEVYGTLGDDDRPFDENSPLAPRNPYAASKAAADVFVMAFHHTHGMDTLIARCSNNYGPRQFPEKLIPLMILNAFDGAPLPIYGDGLHRRDWIHVEDHCAAVEAILHAETSGAIYNVSANDERRNDEVVRAIVRLTGRGNALIRYVPDRPGHDRRYAMNTRKIRDELGWSARRSFDEGLAETVAWYRDNRAWTEGVRSGAYRDYYERQYADRLSRA